MIRKIYILVSHINIKKVEKKVVAIWYDGAIYKKEEQIKNHCAH
jgi:hypothetical protein